MLSPDDKHALSKGWFTKTAKLLADNVMLYRRMDASRLWVSWGSNRFLPSTPSDPSDVRQYVKACLISNAVELRATNVLPEEWRNELIRHGVIEEDLSWMRVEAWDLGRMALAS